MARLGLWLVITLSASLAGCASVVNGSRQTVGINTTPTGATVKVDGSIVGKTPWTGKIARKDKTVIALEKVGYEGQLLPLQGEMSGWVWANLLWGLPGFLSTTTDYSSGGVYQYEPGSFHVALDRVESNGVQSASQSRETNIKRFILANYAHILRQIAPTQQKGRVGSGVTEAPEYLRTLRGMMGMDELDDQAFRDRLRPAAESQSNADAFAEAVILMLEFENPKN